MKRYLAVVIILFMAGFIAACDIPSQQSLTAVKAHESNTKLTDSELEAAIRAKLNRNQAFSKVRLIVDSENALVVLSGTVESEQLRTQACEIARNGNAELLITDRMKVESR
jgi:outer membrane lipopolysaccharide assembly protein LptE/RlpB